VDDPSAKMWTSFRDLFPRLEVISLDPVHLPIVYEYATWKKRSKGSRYLRQIMAKFTAYDASVNPTIWGEPFAGVDAKPLGREEDMYRDQILKQSMNLGRAQSIKENLKADQPFYSRVEFIEAIASLCALFKEEVVRKVASANKVIFRILWSSTRDIHGYNPDMRSWKPISVS